MEKDQRLFHYTDNEALEKATVLHSVATSDLANLNAFDGDIDAQFMTDWQAAIASAEAVLPDSIAKAYLEQKTAIVGQCHAACIEAVRDLRYHASKAFTKKSGEWALFNFKGLAKARTTTAPLAVYVSVLHLVANSLSAELIAKGMTAPQIAALGTSAQALFAADVAQEHQKHHRLRTTFERIATINIVWRYCQQVHQAGQIVYDDDYAKHAQYAL